MPLQNILIKKIAVLGSGVMGAQIAAHCINARVPVVLFDLAQEDKNPHGIVLRALDNLKKINPAPLADVDQVALIEAADYEHDLERLLSCDLIIEAVAERSDIKQSVYQKIAPYIKAEAIIASNTSGLSISSLAQFLPAALQARFCGVHFFNPPRYMHLVELIATSQTQNELLDQLETFLTSTLGKGVVRTKDTPNFIANRVGIFSMLATMHHTVQFGLSCDVVDDLTGTKLGRAKSATYRTADVVGLDTMMHVINTMQKQLPDDPFAKIYKTPEVLQKLIDSGCLGQKTGAGFYKKVGKDILRLNLKSGEYEAGSAKADDLLSRILKEKDPAKRLKALRESTHQQAQFVWSILRDVFHYAAIHMEDIAFTAREIDFAMRWGFGWQEGPFELWQAAGWQTVLEWIEADIAAGKTLCSAPLPAWVRSAAVFNQQGVHGIDGGSYNPSIHQNAYRSGLAVYQRQLFPANVLNATNHNPSTAGTTVLEDDAVRIWHQDDDILILSFKTKMHVISPQVIEGMLRALNEAEKHYQGLVIWQTDAAQGGAFSAGADLQSMLPLFMSGGVAAIEPVVNQLQNAHQALKYAQVPVVAAVAGLALGGGCELLLHATRRVAYLESYIGLVEVGVGLVPAGGGLKEMAVRASAIAQNGQDLFTALKSFYLNAAMAHVSKSAHEAKKMGYLQQDDVIVMNPYELLYAAKQQVKALYQSVYRPPLLAPVKVAGRHAIANILGQLVNLREGGFISAYDFKLGQMIAEIMSGGEVEMNSMVDQQWLLDLERKAFMELLTQPKTQERIMGMLQTGKPVRN